jgi:3',5'-cyclic-nucleotide phosphodiesterase
MDLRVIGCHGGETPRHKNSGFVLDDVLTFDAGSLTSGLDLATQCKLEACLITHAHMDHIRDLATLADNRVQNGCPPLLVVGNKVTIGALRKHVFNDLIWPDFSVLPTPERPTIQYLEIKPEKPIEIAGRLVRSVPVHHTIDGVGFLVENGRDGTIAYSGDTGPTDRLWQVLNDEPNLKALLLEVSYPNGQQKLATISGHHTPRTLAADLAKYRAPKDLPTLLYHLKPTFQAEIEKECAALEGLNLTVLQIGDQFVL